MSYSLGRPSAGDSPFAIGEHARRDQTSPQPPSQKNPQPRRPPAGQVGPNGFMQTPSPYGSVSDEARRRYEERYAKKRAEDEAKARAEQPLSPQGPPGGYPAQQPPPAHGGYGGPPPQQQYAPPPQQQQYGGPPPQQHPPSLQSQRPTPHPPFQSGPAPAPQSSFGPPPTSSGSGYGRPPPQGYRSPQPPQSYQSPPPSAPPGGYAQQQQPHGYAAQPAPQNAHQPYQPSHQPQQRFSGGGQQWQQQQPPAHSQQQYSSPPPPSEDHELRSMFSQFDSSRTGQLSYRDLQRLLEKDATMEAREDCIKMLMNIFDTDRSGSINFLEFEGLYRYIQDWHGIFRRFDRDNSGLIDRKELHAALQGFGFSLPAEMVRKLEKRFAPPPRHGDDGRSSSPGISFDRFLMACVTVKHYTESFRKHDGGTGRVTLDYNTYMDIVMDAPS